ncbi:MAG TPA: hypothetical protein VHL11_09860 [Phototrophicaceae bacterium]|nr:hypothetical protein [Phototrophicaceae bacterium]
MQSAPRSRPAYLPIVLLMIVLVFPVFAGNTKIYDQKAHRDFARILLEEGHLVTPHFGYHLILLGVNATIPGGNLLVAGVAVNIAAYVIAGVLFFRYAFGQLVDQLPQLAERLVLVLAGIAVIIGPPVMLSWYLDFRLNGYIILNQFHSPTQSVVLPMAMVLFALCLRLLNTGHLSRIGLVGLAALALITPLTKPNFSMVLLPALTLVIVWRLLRRETVPWRALILTVFIPTALALGWQFYFTYVQQTVIGYGLNPSNGIIFAPLKTALYFDPSLVVVAIKLLVSLAFPLWVVSFYPSVRRNLAIRLGWLMILIGLAQYLLLAEAGEFYMAANFNWGLRTITLFVFALSLVDLVKATFIQIQERRPDARLIGAVLLLITHIIGGMYLYYGYASSIVPTLP